MRVILDDMIPRKINFCGYESIAVVLNRYGLNFLKDILGVEFGFDYKTNSNLGLGIEYEQWCPEYFFTSEIHSVREIMHALYGYNIKEIIENDYYTIQNKMQEYLRYGYPLIIDVDAYELPYFEEYKKYHPKSPHCIIIYGYDDKSKKFFFMDSFRGHINGIYHEILFDNMKYLFVPEDNIFNLKYRFWYIDKEVLLKKNNGEKWFLDSLYYMKAKGFVNMKNLEEDLILISKWGLSERMIHYKEEMTNMTILASQQRYGNFLYISDKADWVDSTLITEMNEIFKKWNSLKLCFYNIRRRECKEVFENAAVILNAILETEIEFVNDFIRVGEKHYGIN